MGITSYELRFVAQAHSLSHQGHDYELRFVAQDNLILLFNTLARKTILELKTVFFKPIIVLFLQYLSILNTEI
jgi:hypothetical protein